MRVFVCSKQNDIHRQLMNFYYCIEALKGSAPSVHHEPGYACIRAAFREHLVDRISTKTQLPKARGRRTDNALIGGASRPLTPILLHRQTQLVPNQALDTSPLAREMNHTTTGRMINQDHGQEKQGRHYTKKNTHKTPATPPHEVEHVVLTIYSSIKPPQNPWIFELILGKASIVSNPFYPLVVFSCCYRCCCCRG